MGALFAGRYELVDPLGEGGGGQVWRAWDHRERTFVAAKVLRQVDAASLLRFMREQSVRVTHPHVVTPLGWAGEDDRVLFTMPLVHGGSAATLVGDHGPLPPRWAATLLDHLLAGLAQVHRAGVVHRDVTPANLLLEATGSGLPHGRLSDFGLATTAGGPRLTTGPVAHGTPGYLAPETLRGAAPDPAADLYGAGVTAYELLVGHPPDPGEDVATGLIRAEVPPALARLVLDLAAQEPGERPPSAGAARERLARTGLVAHHDSALTGEVEVFDHVPELPPGWRQDGPVTAAEAAPSARDAASPEPAPPAHVPTDAGPTEAHPIEAPATGAHPTGAHPTGPSGRTVAGALMVVAGAVALLVALVLALG